MLISWTIFVQYTGWLLKTGSVDCRLVISVEIMADCALFILVRESIDDMYWDCNGILCTQHWILLAL